MVARVEVSKCREKCKKTEKPILAPKGTPPSYVLLYPHLPPPSASSSLCLEGEAASDGESPAANMLIRLSLGVLETTTIPSSSGPMNLMLNLNPPVLTPQLPARLAPRFNQEHLNSPTMGLASPWEPTTLQMPVREVQGQIYYDQHGQIQGGRQTFVYQPFTTIDLLNWKHLYLPPFVEKPQALTDLMQSIIQTHLDRLHLDKLLTASSDSI
jgi:hypothetical protein